MRKSVIVEGAGGQAAGQEDGVEWMDLETLARVEISSEDELFPIEHALGSAVTTGWRAAKTGPQVIRLRFDDPVEVHRVQIHVVERAAERVQEMVIWVGMTGSGRQEVRRQQFTFSPGGTTEELEDFAVELKGVTMLELEIDPDRSHVASESRNYATLQRLRVS